jgi:hypothetical protein
MASATDRNVGRCGFLFPEYESTDGQCGNQRTIIWFSGSRDIWEARSPQRATFPFRSMISPGLVMTKRRHDFRRILVKATYMCSDGAFW